MDIESGKIYQKRLSKPASFRSLFPWLLRYLKERSHFAAELTCLVIKAMKLQLFKQVPETIECILVNFLLCH
jgi:hypothetical protein